MSDKTVQIIVRGLVQGVGFRPFIYRIAIRHNLTGWVKNTNENVLMRISGNPDQINLFTEALRNEAPPVAIMEEVDITEIDNEYFAAFTIQQSKNISDGITEISPDIAVCAECMEDTGKEGNRFNYPFVNCTNCGPRFTIIQDLPYDRKKTTMHHFLMCPVCSKEYETVTDRRFHAQPTACSDCGPHYQMFIQNKIFPGIFESMLGKLSEILINEGVVLIKGLGGMHLACDAFSEAAVAKLRGIKKRDGKPFAVMFRDLDAIKQFANPNPEEEASLLSWRRPIVLLEKNVNTAQDLPSNLNAGLSLIGVMLPYLPLHHMLFSRIDTPAIVLTSGNFSHEPILTENNDALSQFSDHVDAIVLHNRDIYNRTDDSVVRIIGGKERVFRRSRGYVPTPIRTCLNTDGIVAFGAELTNCFCVGNGEKAIFSQHIGDLQGLETTQFYEQTIARFLNLFRIKPTLLVVDMHPEYISTKTALNFGEILVVRVQHHHAHIAACMTEHNLDEKVIGIALDGTGYGGDGHIWGGEFLVCNLIDYTRFAHFDYIPLPGGDRAAEEPWRTAVSWLYKVFGIGFLGMNLSMLREIEMEKIEMVVQMIYRNINTPLSSGAGRLFDAVSSLLGLCHVAKFQAEGPMRLEAIVLSNCRDSYHFSSGEIIGFDATLQGIISDLALKIDKRIIATKFHNTIISAIFETAKAIREKEGLNKVVLSGGVFQNKYILEGTTNLLQKYHFDVFSHCSVPTNDGGIALGQLAIASKRRSLKCV